MLTSFLQKYFNQPIAVEYKIYSQQSSTPSSVSIRQRTQNKQHQQYEATDVPLITGIHIPDIRAIIYVDEENESQYGSDINDGSNIDKEDKYFQPHNNYASDEEDNNEKDGVVENW